MDNPNYSKWQVRQDDGNIVVTNIEGQELRIALRDDCVEALVVNADGTVGEQKFVTFDELKLGFSYCEHEMNEELDTITGPDMEDVLRAQGSCLRIVCKYCGCEGLCVNNAPCLWEDPVTGEMIEG